MAIVKISIDPNAVAMDGDAIIGKINDAGTTTTISKAGVVAAAARPIEDAEVTAAKVAAGVAKDNLDAMAATERGYIATDPASGQFVITSIERKEDGHIEFAYDDVAKP
jgi:hypothetical protein